MKIVVTGGAGFIGSNFLNVLVRRHSRHHFINLDKLTYAANLFSLKDIESCPNYHFVQVDIADFDAVMAFFKKYDPDWVVHFAAESHVDRSILGPSEFIKSNINGTFNLLETCRATWKTWDGHLFHHVSTDEVYGSLGETGFFTEKTKYDPSSPYAASKASGDHLVLSYYKTYGLPVKISNCSNNYGPRQFPEKLIPLMILNAVEGKPLPVYGDGRNVRDWLYVDDHTEAIWSIIQNGQMGRTYNIGGHAEKTNNEVVRSICQVVASELNKPVEELEKLITYVPDRPGHDRRYALDTSRIQAALGWNPRENFETGLEKTVRWYLKNQDWVNQIRTGEYRRWIEQNYSQR